MASHTSSAHQLHFFQYPLSPVDTSSMKGEIMARTKSRSWKNERASVTMQSKLRPRSNKYSRSDSGEKPGRGSRQRIWVGGYSRADGSRVHGHYRSMPM
jgi:hypothetical protein